MLYNFCEHVDKQQIAAIEITDKLSFFFYNDDLQTFQRLMNALQEHADSQGIRIGLDRAGTVEHLASSHVVSYSIRYLSHWHLVFGTKVDMPVVKNILNKMMDYQKTINKIFLTEENYQQMLASKEFQTPQQKKIKKPLVHAPSLYRIYNFYQPPKHIEANSIDPYSAIAHNVQAPELICPQLKILSEQQNPFSDSNMNSQNLNMILSITAGLALLAMAIFLLCCQRRPKAAPKNDANTTQRHLKKR